MSESYSALGDWFEYLNGDCGYEKWSQYLLNKLKTAGNFRTGLDVGCGNGYFTRAFNKAGYRVDGMDISVPMLNVAKKKAAAEGIRCEFLLGDIAKLKVMHRVDFVTAVNDCINYVPPQSLVPTFKKVHAALNTGGVFLFDISSENKIRNILSDNMFGSADEDLSYIWFNEQTDGGVRMELTFFKREADGRYLRYDETHYQFAHKEEDVLLALASAGFSSATAEGFLNGDKSERIQFTAFRTNG